MLYILFVCRGPLGHGHLKNGARCCQFQDSCNPLSLSLCRVTSGFNILCQIMVTFLSYISNACHSLPGVAERLHRSERLCLLCMHGVGDEKHLVFECSALNGIRLRFPHLFTGFHTMSSFMNQAAQRDVMHFITDCLRAQP